MAFMLPSVAGFQGAKIQLFFHCTAFFLIGVLSLRYRLTCSPTTIKPFKFYNTTGVCRFFARLQRLFIVAIIIKQPLLYDIQKGLIFQVHFPVKCRLCLFKQRIKTCVLHFPIDLGVKQKPLLGCPRLNWLPCGRFQYHHHTGAKLP